jgi:hypothetical protein
MTAGPRCGGGKFCWHGFLWPLFHVLGSLPEEQGRQSAAPLAAGLCRTPAGGPLVSETPIGEGDVHGAPPPRSDSEVSKDMLDRCRIETGVRPNPLGSQAMLRTREDSRDAPHAWPFVARPILLPVLGIPRLCS